jgi:predicted Rossmann fold flavoprotein
VQNLFARYGLDATIHFFESIGIPFVEKKQGKLYPCSLQAQSVVDILEYEMQRSGAILELHRRADNIIAEGNSLAVITAGHEKSLFDSVILAAGSCAWPQLGASDQGYDLARALGHTLIKPFPSILPITIPLKILHRLEGIKWDCEVRARSRGKILGSSTGEVLFTRYGLSGPATLEVSRHVNEKILCHEDVEVLLDLFPEKSEGELFEFLSPLFSDSEKTAAFAFAGILKKRMSDIFLAIAGVDPESTCGSFDEKKIRSLASFFKNVILEPGDVRPFSEAVVVAGGIDTDEVNPATMESKQVKGLFLCGELLDIDGDSGGFNLQFAWSTGALAGMSQN